MTPITDDPTEWQDRSDSVVVAVVSADTSADLGAEVSAYDGTGDTTVTTLDARIGATSATVRVDGVDISHALTGLTITAGAGEGPTATLDLAIHEESGHHVTATDVRLRVPDDTRDALVALGWTPPDGC